MLSKGMYHVLIMSCIFIYIYIHTIILDCSCNSSCIGMSWWTWLLMALLLQNNDAYRGYRHKSCLFWFRPIFDGNMMEYVSLPNFAVGSIICHAQQMSWDWFFKMHAAKCLDLQPSDLGFLLNLLDTLTCEVWAIHVPQNMSGRISFITHLDGVGVPWTVYNA